MFLKNATGLGLNLFTRSFPKLCCQKKAKLLQDPKKFLLAHSSISTVLIFDLSISSKSLSTILFVVPDLVYQRCPQFLLSICECRYSCRVFIMF